MTKSIQIQIPLRKHLYKYVLVKYPTRFTKNHQMGVILYSMLRNCKFNPEASSTHDGFPCLWQIEVTEFMIERKYIAANFTREFVNQFDTVLDCEFKKDLCNYVKLMSEKGIERKIAIEKFCELYNIHEQDISFEALKKAEYRFRKESQPALAS